jgi:hypothetical protein
MANAAKALQQAAQQMAQQQKQPGNPSQNPTSSQVGVAPMGLPDLSQFGKDYKKYQGKPWGELPGELRTRILQDMQAKYGEDYARVIKLYFEQLADKK